MKGFGGFPLYGAAAVALAAFGAAVVVDAPSARAQTSGPQYDPALYRGMEWRNIGPFRGGRSVAVAGVASDSKTYYFGGVGGGVWKTEDGGETWRPISDDTFKTSSVGAIAVAESDPNVIYVGMGEHAARGVMTSHGDGVYKSTDAGKTWKHMGLERTRAISRIRIHPRNPDLAYVAAQGAVFGPTKERGIYRTNDGGETWDLVLYVGETAGASDLSMDRKNPRILYAAFWDHQRTPWEVRSGGPGSGIHKSTDGGETWEKLTRGFPERIGKVSVDVSPDSNRVYAIVEADPGGGLYRSDDAGKNWTLTNEDWSIRARAWYYIEVFADPTNENVVYVLDAPMMKSIDGGKTFSRVRVPHGDNHDLWIHPEDGRIMINANDGGANISTNGGRTWSTQENQPTAQFYRVATDHQFPYHVYGGQQDNTSVAIVSRTFGGGIGWKDWYTVGGCESAYAAFNPDDPVLVYAGCYMGQITEWDRRTEDVRNVMAYPVLPAAIPPREMKYRFNWNAPILVSIHDPKVVFHAGNVLLKTENRGETWVEISPDLTSNEPEKQGPGGGPITNEGAGGEIYNTIYYVAESPHEAGTLWVGSDDGLLHLTRDEGGSWENVTPKGLGEAMIHSIEVSPHDPATAYVAVSRYKFNDLTPHAFKTTNYGRSWDRIVGGIPAEEWVRVIREDPVRKNLLYMGTEAGMYVSFDGGKSWQSLKLNLPITPVTDLAVKGSDLVAATSGRAFWILDDLSPLRQIDEEVAASGFHMFRPRPAYRVNAFEGFGGSDPRAGKNPPPGAILDYYLKDAPESPIRLDVLNASGAVIRSYSSEAKPDETTSGPGSEKPLPAKAGMNRFNWDLRHESVKGVPGLYVFGTLMGRKAVPGTYQVRLTVGGQSLTQPFEVLKDPRIDVTQADFEKQDGLAAEIDAELVAIHEGVIRLRAVRDQIEDLLKRAGEQESGESIQEAGRALVEKLTEMEDTLIQKRTVDGQTVINFPMRLNQHYIYLRSAVDDAEGMTTDGARKRLADLSAQWGEHRAVLDRLLGEELDRFNAVVRETGVPAVIPGSGPRK